MYSKGNINRDVSLKYYPIWTRNSSINIFIKLHTQIFATMIVFVFFMYRTPTPCIYWIAGADLLKQLSITSLCHDWDFWWGRFVCLCFSAFFCFPPTSAPVQIPRPSLCSLPDYFVSLMWYMASSFVLSAVKLLSCAILFVTSVTLSLLDLSSDWLATSFQPPGCPTTQPPAPLQPSCTQLWILCVVSSWVSISASGKATESLHHHHTIRTTSVSICLRPSLTTPAEPLDVPSSCARSRATSTTCQLCIYNRFLKPPCPGVSCWVQLNYLVHTITYSSSQFVEQLLY